MSHDVRLPVGALARYLERNGVPVAGALTATQLAGGRSNPTYAVTDGTTSWILRRPPYGMVLASAHDMSREARVLRALEPTAVPVPRVPLLCEDPDVIGAPFFLMEHLDGRTLRTPADVVGLARDDLGSLSDRLVDVLVALHDVDPVAVGLGDWGRPEGFLERQVVRWRTQWEASRTRDLRLIDDLLRELGATTPVSRHLGIVHGDYKLDNLLLATDDVTRVRGLLDWELSTRGDTLTDLGYLLAHWDEPGRPPHPISAGTTAAPGFAGADHLAERYAVRTGRDLSAIDWYIALADTKVAIILEGIHSRHLAGHTTGTDFEGMAEHVETLAARAAERLRMAPR